MTHLRRDTKPSKSLKANLRVLQQEAPSITKSTISPALLGRGLRGRGFE
jgi:hypothetical protein